MSNCNNCSGCSGGCAGCSGCGSAMELTEGEIKILLDLGQIPFLPVARKMGEDVPVYLEDDTYPVEEYSLILQCLEKRGLISIDYELPLKGWDYSAYKGFPVHGSFALTARGQEICDLLDRLGCEADA